MTTWNLSTNRATVILIIFPNQLISILYYSETVIGNFINKCKNKKCS